MTTNPEAPRDVVCAVIVRYGRILLTQRVPHKALPFAWCTPGGKVDPGESRREALHRELLEELNVVVDAIAAEPLWGGEVQLPHGRYRPTFYAVTLDSEQHPQPMEGQGMGWFTAEELQRLTLTPADQLALAALQKHMAEWREP